MTFTDRLKGVGIAFAILVLAFPPSAIITIVCAPLWRWFELQSGIESYGHSGPAEWCYLATYIVVVAACTVFWSRVQRVRSTRKDNRETSNRN
jgi:hypothetical protein